MNLSIGILLLIVRSCLADNSDRSDRSKISDSLDNSVYDKTNARNKSNFALTPQFYIQLIYKAPLCITLRIKKGSGTLESTICRSVTRLNLATCIYLFWETDYNQPFQIN